MGKVYFYEVFRCVEIMRMVSTTIFNVVSYFLISLIVD